MDDVRLLMFDLVVKMMLLTPVFRQPNPSDVQCGPRTM
jgi:hypothetical protein